MSKQGTIVVLAIISLAAYVACGQFWRSRGSDSGTVHVLEGGETVDESTQSTAREVPSHSTEVPMWTNALGFEKDVFTFCRVVYNRTSYGKGGYWHTDFPDSDLNLSYRLQQVTSLRVSPDGRFLRLKNKDLSRYPWVYMVEPGRLFLDDEEVAILRKYLLNGGFMMVDDFWGASQWENFHREMKKVFPEREFVELPMEHPVFHSVFDLTVPKNKLQTPNMRQGIRSLDPNSSDYGMTWEYYHNDSDPASYEDMHVRAISDDKGRIMVIATHNCDNGDGWEREGEHDGFFHEFSEKRAFPLGINIIVYAMTH